MGKHIDLSDRIFGKLIVIDRERDPKYIPEKQRSAWWYCLCECGGFKRVPTYRLTKGIITHCGCEKGRDRLDIRGNTYGELTVLFPSEDVPGKNVTTWMTQCSCGRYRRVRTTILRANRAKSCGVCKPHPNVRPSLDNVFEEIGEVCRIGGKETSTDRPGVRETDSGRRRARSGP